MNAQPGQQEDQALAAGREALLRGDWGEARAHFEAAVALGETPEALEALGLAAWWQQNGPATFDARERAYRRYHERGDRIGAARVAHWLADDYAWFRGEPAVAGGWLQRAYRLLDGLPVTPELAWCHVREGEIALLYHGDLAAARRHGREAVTIGRALGEVDVEMYGLAVEGLTLVATGEVADGFRALDEASAAAIGREIADPVAMANVCCLLISACERVRDYARAAQWCASLRDFCARWRFGWILTFCRLHHAAILVWRGAFADAEAELSAAIAELTATRPPIAVEGIVRLAELRRRQGRLDEAEALFARAELHPLALLGRASLALGRDDPSAAVALVERFLRRTPDDDRTARVPALELAVVAHAALGDAERLEPHLAELQSVARTIGTAPVRAAVAFAEGTAAAAAGHHDAARRRLEDAADLYRASGASFETAQARLALSRALAALDRRAEAEREAQGAREAFEAIGAAREAERASALLGSLARAPATAGPGTHGNPLSRREREVLGLVAHGLTNAAIAERLVVSEHTIHRHVANILTKLSVSSRAAAVAKATREDLL